MLSTAYQVYTFHQLPVINADRFRAQYHVVIRVGINGDGTVRWSSATTFLISLHPRERTDLEIDTDRAFGDQTEDADQVFRAT